MYVKKCHTPPTKRANWFLSSYEPSRWVGEAWWWNATPFHIICSFRNTSFTWNLPPFSLSPLEPLAASILVCWSLQVSDVNKGIDSFHGSTKSLPWFICETPVYGMIYAPYVQVQICQCLGVRVRVGTVARGQTLHKLCVHKLVVYTNYIGTVARLALTCPSEGLKLLYTSPIGLIPVGELLVDSMVFLSPLAWAIRCEWVPFSLWSLVWLLLSWLAFSQLSFVFFCWHLRYAGFGHIKQKLSPHCSRGSSRKQHSHFFMWKLRGSAFCRNLSLCLLHFLWTTCWYRI